MSAASKSTKRKGQASLSLNFSRKIEFEIQIGLWPIVRLNRGAGTFV